MDEAGPTARALLALGAIHDQPGITGERLAARLGVSDRAARRYVGILREAGIRIESTPGRHGGYRVGRGTRVPPLVFSATEALGLVMAALEGRHAVEGDDDPVGRALAKIVSVLPASLAEPAEALRRVARPDPDGSAPDASVTAALVRSAEEGRGVRVTYARGKDRAVEMELDPWAVSVWHGRWYLLCWSHTSAAQRVLRVDRVLGVEVGETRFERPEDLDPITALEEHLARGWSHPVEVVVEAPLEQVRGWVPRQWGRLEEIDASTTRLVGSTDNPEWYCAQLLQIEAPYRFVGSPAVRATALRVGQRLLDAAGG